MYRNSLFDNPIAIFLLVLSSAFINILFPVHFISIFLVGVLFIAFSRAIHKKYFYTLFFIIVGFCVIEASHGLRFFNVTLLSFFIYIFISPIIKSILSSINFYFISVILSFYIGLGILFYWNGGVDSHLISVLIMNYFIDIVLVSIIL